MAGADASVTQSAVTATIVCLALRWRTARSCGCDGAACSGRWRPSGMRDDTSSVAAPVGGTGADGGCVPVRAAPVWAPGRGRARGGTSAPAAVSVAGRCRWPRVVAAAGAETGVDRATRRVAGAAEAEELAVMGAVAGFDRGARRVAGAGEANRRSVTD